MTTDTDTTAAPSELETNAAPAQRPPNPFCGSGHPSNGYTSCGRIADHDGDHSAYTFSIAVPETWPITRGCRYCGAPIDYTRRSPDCDAFSADIGEGEDHPAGPDCICSCCTGDCPACCTDLHTPTNRRES